MLAGVFAAFVMTVALAAPAMAEEGTFTMKESVALPNAVLAPGTYTFKQLGTSVIEVSDVNGRNICILLTVASSSERNGETTSTTVLKVRKQRVESIHFADSDLDMLLLYPKTESAKTDGL
jgi:hypothetical protein